MKLTSKLNGRTITIMSTRPERNGATLTGVYTHRPNAVSFEFAIDGDPSLAVFDRRDWDCVEVIRPAVVLARAIAREPAI